MFRTLKNIFAKKYGRIEERPYFDYKLKDLEELYLKFLSLGDKGAVDTIVNELSFRTTNSSKELLKELQGSIKLLSSSVTIDSPDKNPELTSPPTIETTVVDEETLSAKKKSNVSQFVSFHVLVEDLARSDKPELLIDANTWKMLCRSLKNDDRQYMVLSEFAKKLECSWPYTKSKEKIRDYLDIDFDELKTGYGWDQKRVIISAVAMTSYAKLKSWRVLNERYGTRTKEGEFLSAIKPAQPGNVTANEKLVPLSVNSITLLKAAHGGEIPQSEKKGNPAPRDLIETTKSNVDDILNDFGL